jgi:hypothetical protein
MRGASKRWPGSWWLIVAVVTLSTPALAADPSNGLRIAHRWCEACHVVTATQTRPATDQAPPFEASRGPPASTPARSHCSCSTRIQRCRIWVCRAQTPQTSPRISRRSISSVISLGSDETAPRGICASSPTIHSLHIVLELATYRVSIRWMNLQVYPAQSPGRNSPFVKSAEALPF